MDPKELKGKSVVEFVDVFDDIDRKLFKLQKSLREVGINNITKHRRSNMVNKKITDIPVESLLINTTNPRHDKQSSQREAIFALAFDEPGKLIAMAKDIAKKGLNPSELPIVAEADENGMYRVLEGNRRIAAIKLVKEPALLTSIGLPPKIEKQYREIYATPHSLIPSIITCAVLTHKDANHWILLKHTGENGGVGVVPWKGVARHRFRGQSPALQVIEMVKNYGLLSDETLRQLPEISITNIERLIKTPDASRELGIRIKNRLIEIIGNQDDVLNNLALVVSDIANERINVSDLDNKDQRINYAKEIISRKSLTRSTNNQNTQKKAISNSASRTKPLSLSKKTTNPIRQTLIPKNFEIQINSNRLSVIFKEMKELKIEKSTNCCSVLLRVFLELSIDHYAKRHGMLLTKPPKKGSTEKKDMTLREKIKEVLDYFETNEICTKDELKGVRISYNNRDHLFSVDTLNAYIHNKDVTPSPSDLRATWDNIQLFIQHLWE